LFNGVVFGRAFNVISLGDVAQCFGGYRTLTGSMQNKKFSPRMCKTTEFSMP
jgi:hypothetical protein